MNTLEKEINSFIGQRGDNITHRYASFDFCYNYFFNNKGKLSGDNLQISCCQLWAYLSSWGMVARGNVMQSKSYAILKDVIAYINNHPEYYNIKITDTDYVEKVQQLYTDIDNKLNITEQKNRKTLVTKIILGTYACCPAFDSRFCRTFGASTQGKLSDRDLKKVVAFYTNEKNKKIIDNFSKRTLSFDKKTPEKCHQYTPAKIIDMYGFIHNCKLK
ncbi:MAG: hypothetical protein K6E93_05865 [Bacteroidales bacterium]|nr:hypothetical protein [Bacteroidales bacterium]